MRVLTFTDANSVTWYAYPNSDLQFIVTDTDPTPAAGVWDEHDYFRYAALTASTADSGITYYTFENTAGNTRYLYAHTDGSLIITSTEPT